MHIFRSLTTKKAGHVKSVNILLNSISKEYLNNQVLCVLCQSLKLECLFKLKCYCILTDTNGETCTIAELFPGFLLTFQTHFCTWLSLVEIEHEV